MGRQLHLLALSLLTIPHDPGVFSHPQLPDKLQNLSPTVLPKKETSNLSNSSLPQINGIFSATIVDQIFVPKKVHKFIKELPFAQTFQTIIDLQLEVENLNPSFSSSEFETVSGAHNEFLRTHHLRTSQQNNLKCLELGGSMISWQTLIRERLPTTQSVTLKDHLIIQTNTMTCNINEEQFSDIQCLKQIKQIAQNIGSRFAYPNTLQLYNEILTQFPNTVIYLQVKDDVISFNPNQLASTFCSTTNSQPQQSDEFTKITKQKFYSHLSTLVNQIIDSMYSTLRQLSSTFSYHLEISVPSTSQKSPADLCNAIRNIFPLPFSAIGNTDKTSLSNFFETILPKIKISNDAFSLIKSKITKYCAEPTVYEKYIRKIFSNLLVFNLNTKNILKSYSHKYSDNSLIVIPSQLQLIHTSSMTESDYVSLYSSLIKANLDSDELKLLILSIENEKSAFVRMNKEFLPTDFVMPKVLHFDIFIF